MRKLRIRLLAAFGAAGCALMLTTAPAGAQELSVPVPAPVPELPLPSLELPPAPVPDEPLVNVSPDVAVGVCGNGVAIAGTGTTSDCASQQSSAPSDSDAAIDASPTVQAGVCGNGVAVAGLGTSSDCSDQQEVAAHGGTAGLLDASPTVQAGVCGNGVAVAGAGTTAVCGAQAGSDPTPDDPGDGIANGSVGDANEVLADLESPAGTGAASNGDGSTLPVTGFEPVLLALAGLALASTGGLGRLGVPRG